MSRVKQVIDEMGRKVLLIIQRQAFREDEYKRTAENEIGTFPHKFPPPLITLKVKKKK